MRTHNSHLIFLAVCLSLAALVFTNPCKESLSEFADTIMTEPLLDSSHSEISELEKYEPLSILVIGEAINELINKVKEDCQDF